MQRLLYTALFLFAMLISLVGTAGAAPLASRSATLVNVMYTEKGPVFTFDVSDKFSRSELNGSLEVQGGGKYGLYCTQVDEDTVACNTSKEVSGVNVSLSWGGFIFWTYVPEAPSSSHSPSGPTSPSGPPSSSQYCYTVYDFGLENTWQSYGTTCQNSPAEYGDEIPWYSPDWDEEYDAVFAPMGPICSEIYEDAYYYPACLREEE